MSTYTFQNGDGPYLLFPTSITPTSFKLRHARTTLKSESVSGRIMTRSRGGTRIEGNFSFPPMKTAEYEPFMAFFRQLDGRNTIFVMRIPFLRDDTIADSNFRVGEYYNRDTIITNKSNQLVQYLGLDGTTPITDPQMRESGSVTLKTHAQLLPHLRCSLASDAPTVEYSDDGFVRVSLDVIERW